ncbi:TonB-dependent receptor [Termitidicoccus mucosus]|uniref:TonB-dependent receptor n=1 Tax=Termitidicoccus mucosus TaxID=1184151 RepID=A0A178IN88_9BACT|nr:hypothetical protein AW736_03485 [Opitutaceae bacterium TSB47]
MPSSLIAARGTFRLRAIVSSQTVPSLLALCSLLAAPRAAIAQTTGATASGTLVTTSTTAASASKEPVFQLGTLTVYGERPLPSEQMETSITASKIELLEKKTVAEALATTPGVTLSPGSGNRYETFAYVRGFGSLSVPIYIDGIPAYIPYDGNLDLGRFTTFDVASIHVAKGYSSVIYGPNAMGGAINLVSRRPTRPLEGNISAGVSTGDGVESSLNIGTRQGKWYAQGGVSFYERDWIKMAEEYNGTDRQNYHTRDWKFSAKAGFAPNATDEYAIGYQHQEGEKGPKVGGKGYSFTSWRWPEWNKETVYFISNTRLGDKSYVKPRVFFDKYDNTLIMGVGRDPSIYDDYSYGGSLELGTELIPKNILKGVVHYKYDRHYEYYELVTGEKDNEETYKDVTVSAGIEDTFHITSKWDFQAGVAYDWRDTRKAGEQTLGLITMDSFNPQAGVFFKLDEKNTFHATIARKTRMPSIKDRYSAHMTPNLIAIPNPDLGPETAMHYEIGYIGEPVSGLTVTANVFFSRVTDKITYKVLPEKLDGMDVRQSYNVSGDVQQDGAELGVDYSLNSILSAGGSYTFIYMKDLRNPANKLTEAPRHSGSLHAKIQPWRWLAIVPSMEARSWRYSNSAGKKIGGFALYNLKASFTPPGSNCVLSIGIENIFERDTRYYDTAYPGRGRTVYTNVRYSF